MTRRSKARRDTRAYRKKAARMKREARVCWICGMPIDPELKSPHPLSFTLDHLQPMALGGDLMGPSLPAHRLCNQKRGTGRGKPRTQGDRSADW